MTLPRCLIVAVLALACVVCSPAAEVGVVTWPTKLAAPPPLLPPSAQSALPAFRTALVVAPEGLLVQLALSQPALLDLPAQAAAKLQPLVQKRYQAIAADPVFQSLPSALGYCFAAERSSLGRAAVYRPAGSSAQTPVMLFMHGYGGSFIWCQHCLAEMLPGWIIICPAHGISPSTVPAAYLAESLAAAEKLLGHPLKKPVLAGLSAGAFGVARVFAREPATYDRLVLLAAYPPDDAAARFTPATSVHALAGGQEVFVADGKWARTLQGLRQRRVPVAAELIPAADHFFLLTHPAETAAWLKKACGGGVR